MLYRILFLSAVHSNYKANIHLNKYSSPVLLISGESSSWSSVSVCVLPFIWTQISITSVNNHRLDFLTIGHEAGLLSRQDACHFNNKYFEKGSNDIKIHSKLLSSKHSALFTHIPHNIRLVLAAHIGQKRLI